MTLMSLSSVMMRHLRDERNYELVVNTTNLLHTKEINHLRYYHNNDLCFIHYPPIISKFNGKLKVQISMKLFQTLEAKVTKSESSYPKITSLKLIQSHE